jgi:hypothetical protein
MGRIAVCLVLLMSASVYAGKGDFATLLCAKDPVRYGCVKAGKGGWAGLFHDPEERRVAMMVNRRNTELRQGQMVAVPRLATRDPMAHSPFPTAKEWLGGNHLSVDLNILAWGAWESDGHGKATLVRWGPANGGSKVCSDTHLPRCKSPVGTRSVLGMYGKWKRSDLYPLDCADKRKCGAKMPWYMKLVSSGEGIHGYAQLPGWNASHGCLRILMEDAHWINKSFAFKGMPVVLADY